MTEPVIRLLVSDVDGTLVRHDKTLSDAVIDAAHRLIAAGGVMTLISARPPSGVLPLARQLGLKHRIGAFNGGTVVTMEGEIIAAVHLDTEASRRGIEIFRAAGFTVWAFVDGEWYASDDTNPHLDREKRSAMIDPIYTDDFSSLHGRIDKVVGVCDEPETMQRVEAEVQAAIGHQANVACSQAYYCDITHPLANKGDGIVTLAEFIGVPLSETAAIGDMPNDLPMLTRAAFPIAMGQAPDRVKAAAKAVSTSNNEDGVAVAIDRYVIPRLPQTVKTSQTVEG